VKTNLIIGTKMIWLLKVSRNCETYEGIGAFSSLKKALKFVEKNFICSNKEEIKLHPDEEAYICSYSIERIAYVIYL